RHPHIKVRLVVADAFAHFQKLRPAAVDAELVEVRLRDPHIGGRFGRTQSRWDRRGKHRAFHGNCLSVAAIRGSMAKPKRPRAVGLSSEGWPRARFKTRAVRRAATSSNLARRTTARGTV